MPTIADQCAGDQAGEQTERNVVECLHDLGAGQTGGADDAAGGQVDAAGEDHERRADCRDGHHRGLAEHVDEVGLGQHPVGHRAEDRDHDDQDGEHGQLRDPGWSSTRVTQEHPHALEMGRTGG